MKVVNIIALIVLILAIGLQFYEKPAIPKRANVDQVFESVPQTLINWRVEDMPLGPTETVVEASERILNLDTFINRVYRQGETEFTVYAAYWQPERMARQLVAAHTPDRCWVANGWVCEEREVYDVFKLTPNTALRTTQYREFIIGGEKRYVLFWHLIGNELHNYGEGDSALQSPISWIAGALEQFAFGTGEQFFIRVDSNRPFEELIKKPGFIEVMKALGELGIKASPNES